LLLDAIKKYIYGSTPMCEALSWSFNAFGEANDANTTQILVIVSDGQGTDGDPVRKMEELTEHRARHNHVWVVCCFIADPDIPCRKELFDREDPSFAGDSGALALFRMSSTIRVDLPPFAHLRGEGWTLPSSGVCRLFLQVNNQTAIEGFLQHVRELFETDDALGHVIHRVELDRLLGERIHTFPAQDQGDTPRCWQYAVSTAIHIALAGVRRFPPSFDRIMSQVAQEMLKVDPKALSHGQKYGKVLGEMKQVFPITYQPVREQGARWAIHAKNPCVVKMELRESQWRRFSSFFGATKRDHDSSRPRS
jgi:hypothetical protein